MTPPLVESSDITKTVARISRRVAIDEGFFLNPMWVSCFFPRDFKTMCHSSSAGDYLRASTSLFASTRDSL